MPYFFTWEANSLPGGKKGVMGRFHSRMCRDPSYYPRKSNEAFACARREVNDLQATVSDVRRMIQERNFHTPPQKTAIAIWDKSWRG